MNPEPSNESTPKEKFGLELPQGAWEENRHPKIRGGLILVAFCLFISLIQNLGSFLGSIAPIIGSTIWERFTNPGSPEFHPQWKLALIYDAVTGTLTLLWTIAMLVFFFRKKRVFPVLVAGSIPIIFLLDLAGYYLSGVIPAVAESGEYAKQGERLIIKFIGLHIWIPYFLLSKRVAKTFVR
jgi:hypothetical protein